MTTTRTSPTRRLLDRTLHDQHGTGLDDWIAERRSAGAGWRTIATALAETTSIDVSHETLRSWYPEGTPAR